MLMKAITLIGRILRWIAAGLFIIIILLAFVLLIPLDNRELVSDPHPVASYLEAIQRIAQIQAGEVSGYNPECHTILMTHGAQVEHGIIFIHGYTNCPEQFRQLAGNFFELGYNVLMVPLPHHGLSDPLTPELSRLTAEELVAYTDTVIDIAHGLGKQVSLGGISGGGVIAAWAAQYRVDLDQAVIISPGFGVSQIPTPLTVPAAKLALVLPNIYVWWDPDLKTVGSIDHAYPRYATRPLAQLIRLGDAVHEAAHRSAPAARSIMVITNAADTSINLDLVREITRHWQEHRASTLTSYEFPADLNLIHDIIDPAQNDQRIDVVYPRLIELIAGP
jgi:pimeloyl-ACP methyl ester carboxylesterase